MQPRGACGGVGRHARLAQGLERTAFLKPLLSRLPILISDVHPLPGSGEPRSALRTMLELDGGTLWVTATHLTTRSAAERAANLRGGLVLRRVRPPELVVLVDSTKFERRSSLIVRPLARIGTVITDDRVEERHLRMLRDAGVGVIVAPTGAAEEKAS